VKNPSIAVLIKRNTELGRKLKQQERWASVLHEENIRLQGILDAVVQGEKALQQYMGRCAE
jgi:hypothetical protein